MVGGPPSSPPTATPFPYTTPFLSEAERVESLGYPDARFPEPASWLVDEERRAAFDGRRGQHFESRYHLTLAYLPPADQVARAERALMERDTPEDRKRTRLNSSH